MTIEADKNSSFAILAYRVQELEKDLEKTFNEVNESYKNINDKLNKYQSLALEIEGIRKDLLKLTSEQNETSKSCLEVSNVMYERMGKQDIEILKISTALEEISSKMTVALHEYVKNDGVEMHRLKKIEENVTAQSDVIESLNTFRIKIIAIIAFVTTVITYAPKVLSLL